jgi:hypothetical protein
VDSKTMTGETMAHSNIFHPARDPKKHSVTQLLLSGETLSWTNILEEVGSFSPRAMGYVLRGLEDQQATILRVRDLEHGTLYRYDPEVPWDDRYRLSSNGSDAHRQREFNGSDTQAT